MLNSILILTKCTGCSFSQYWQHWKMFNLIMLPWNGPVCGLLANTEPWSNLIKTFPVNIKHITDIHATQDILQTLQIRHSKAKMVLTKSFSVWWKKVIWYVLLIPSLNINAPFQNLFPILLWLSKNMAIKT